MINKNLQTQIKTAIDIVLKCSYDFITIDKNEIRIVLGRESVMNFHTLKTLSKLFNTEEINISPHEKGKVWGELTVDPSSPETIHILNWKYEG